MSAFGSLLGQAFARRVLDAALDAKRVASAYLFEGPPGCGKKTAARDLAAALVAPSEDAKRRVLGGLHPDVKSFGPSGRTFKVDLAREIVKEASLRPVEGNSRVFIVDRAEAMNHEAANTLLKCIEEPPAGLHLILVTTQRSSILPTIASRCQSVRFHPLDQASLRQVLEKKLNVGADKARDLAALGNGSVKSAVWLETEDGKAALSLAEGFLEAAASGSQLARLDWALAAFDSDRQHMDRLLGLLAVLLRERWARAKGLPPELQLLSREPAHGRSMQPATLEALMQAVARTRELIARNVNVGLALDELSLTSLRRA